MEEEVFRPQKKSINPAEFQAQPLEDDGIAKLEKMAEVRRAATQEAEQPMGEWRPQIGNVPPQFQKEAERMRQGLPMDRNAPSMRKAGSSKYEDLVGRTKQITGQFEEVLLPSLGKFYNGDDGPSDGRLSLRVMTGEEEELLATQRFVKSNRVMSMILNNCIGKEYNSDHFLIKDRDFLTIYLRGISYTQDYDVEVKCKECYRQFPTTVDLNMLDKTDCPDNFGPKDLVSKLPRTGFTFQYHLPIFLDQQRILDYKNTKNEKFDASQRKDDTMIFGLSVLVDDIEGLTDKLELMQLMKQLPMEDLNYIRNLTNDPPFGVDTEVGMLCPYCAEEFEVPLEMEANFFFPKVKKTSQDETQA